MFTNMKEEICTRIKLFFFRWLVCMLLKLITMEMNPNLRTVLLDTYIKD